MTIEPEQSEARASAPRRTAHAAGAALLGAIDGVLGIALPFAVLAGLALIAWAGSSPTVGWTSSVQVAAVVQLLGHGVDVRFAAPSGAFTATISLLGPAVVTALAAVRAGRRAAGTASPVAAWSGGVVATGIGCAVLLALATSAAARPDAVQAVALPTVLVALVSLVALRSARPSAPPLPAGIRTGLAAAALLLGAAAVLTGALLLVRFSEVIALYEGLSAGPAGGLVLTLAQLLALPVLIVWAAAWTAGAGVALGTGSVSGAFASQVGPLPALPVLGIVPAEPSAAAAAVLLVPVLAGFAAAALARRSGITARALPLGAATGLTAGVVVGLLALAASGAAGPGRFSAVGPDAGLTALLVAVGTGLPAMLAAAVLRPRPREAATGPAEAEQPGR